MRVSSKKAGIILASLFMFLGIMCISPKAEAADDITVNVPTDRAVYQRNASDIADITVDVIYTGEGQVRARVVKGEQIICDWNVIDKKDGSDNEYMGVVKSVPAGGWYELQIAAYDESGNELSFQSIERIGVGEVFITGGQSNSCNFGGAKTQAVYDEVSALNPSTGKWQHCEDSQPCTSDFNTGNGGGSPWPTLGDALVEKLGVPVGFISTGRGSAKISELCDDSDKGFYKYIKTGIEKIEPYGCRAFLMHQGEADTNDTPNAEYLADLQKLIQMTRDDAGYDINWFVARVSYAWSNYNNTEKMNAMTGTQMAACNNYNIFVGPETDDLQGDYRHVDNLHLSEKGLIEHGTRWADAIINKLFTPYMLEADSSVNNGKIVQCGTDLFAGSEVKLSAIADDGYYLVPGSFKVTGEEGDIELTDDSFIMRAENLTVSAEFEQLPAHILGLGSKIKEAEAIDVSQYENAGVTALKNAIEAARTVYANPKATEAETAKAAGDIDAAVKALISKNTVSDTPNNQNPPVNTADNNNQTAAVVNKGDVVKAGAFKYLVTTANTVSVQGLVKKNAKSVTIPKTVVIDGKTYKVTAIGKKAFAGAKKLKKITIKSVTIKSIGKKAFYKVNSAAKIKVPAKKLKTYKKLIVKAGFKKTSNIK